MAAVGAAVSSCVVSGGVGSEQANIKLAGQTQAVLARLKFIGKIRAQTKVDVGSLRLCDTSIAGRAYRHFATPSESKETTYAFLNTTFNEAFELLAILQSSVDEFQARLFALLVAAVDTALKGIQVLTKTYERSDIFISQLQALTEITQTKLNNLR